jgi:DNA-binding XRE family transcriptional regulator
MARAGLNWSVQELADAVGVHRNTITNIEAGRYAPEPETIEKLTRVLRKAGIEFIDENGGGPGVRFKHRQRGK